MSVPDTQASWYSSFRSSAFWEKIVLLVVAASISGLVVPLVVKNIDETRARKASVRQAQERLFLDVSETILTLETLALDVSWFGTPGAKDEENQTKAYIRYNDRTVDLVAKWRAQAARARTLTSPQIAEQLDAMLRQFFENQDTPTISLWGKCNTSCDWSAQHLANEAMLSEANDFVESLARNLGLVRE
jgi:type II secretory pathway pseudopilin PulG